VVSEWVGESVGAHRGSARGGCGERVGRQRHAAVGSCSGDRRCAYNGLGGCGVWVGMSACDDRVDARFFRCHAAVDDAVGTHKRRCARSLLEVTAHVVHNLLPLVLFRLRQWGRGSNADQVQFAMLCELTIQHIQVSCRVARFKRYEQARGKTLSCDVE
jgi:hypothetical protein